MPGGGLRRASHHFACPCPPLLLVFGGSDSRPCPALADSMPVREHTSHSQGFWQASHRAVANARCVPAGRELLWAAASLPYSVRQPAHSALLHSSFVRRSAAAASPRRQVTRMMPIGVPRVPYRTPKEGSWQWVDIWNCLYRERIIFLSKPVDEELGNQVGGWVGGLGRGLGALPTRGAGHALKTCRMPRLLRRAAAAKVIAPSPPRRFNQPPSTQLVATMLYLDSENKKDMNIYINCSGGCGRVCGRVRGVAGGPGVAGVPCECLRVLLAQRAQLQQLPLPLHRACAVGRLQQRLQHTNQRELC